ncbi:myogenesis-regulating glycosidase-like [Argonauta hians]
MMETLKVPSLTVPRAYVERAKSSPASSRKSCVVVESAAELASKSCKKLSQARPKPTVSNPAKHASTSGQSKQLKPVKQVKRSKQQANEIGACVDNIGFQIEDEISGKVDVNCSGGNTTATTTTAATNTATTNTTTTTTTTTTATTNTTTTTTATTNTNNNNNNSNRTNTLQPPLSVTKPTSPLPSPLSSHTAKDCYTDAVASTSKEDLGFTVLSGCCPGAGGGDKHTDSFGSGGDDDQLDVTCRKDKDERDVSVTGTTITSQRGKNVQMLKFSKKEETQNQSYLKRFQLHLIVSVTFLFIIGNLSAVWHFHEEDKLAFKMGQRITFDPSSRVLTFKNAPWGPNTFKGFLANEIPKGWLPLMCSTDKKNTSRMCMRWKGLSQLSMVYYPIESLSCFNISWFTRSNRQLLKDCYVSDLHWFGPSNIGQYQWPLENVSYFHTSNFTYNDVNTFGHLSEHLWFSSNGIVILLPQSTDFQVSWKKTDTMELCVSSRPDMFSPGEQPGAGFPHRMLQYQICYGSTIMETYSVTRKYFNGNFTRKWPSEAMFQHPHWVARAASDNTEVSMATVRDLMSELVSKDFNCSTVEISGKWEVKDGEFVVNSTSLRNIAPNTPCDLMLQVRPYIHHNSPSFNEGIDNNYFIMDASGLAPGLVRWKHGVVAMLDPSSPTASSWYTEKLKQLMSEHHIDSLHFTFDGSNVALPFQPHFSGQVNPGSLNERFSQMMVSLSDKVVVDHVSHSQNSSVFVSVASVIVSNETSTCFTNLIEQALVLGVLGYPYVMADGLSTGDTMLANEQIYQRWLQAAIFFPALRFSVTPWSYPERTIENIKKLLSFRQKVIFPYLMSLKEEVVTGSLFIRPIWWSNPEDSTSILIKDQFLVGDSVLVAPILCDHQSHRDIYIPRGIWQDSKSEKVVDGPMWLYNYTVTVTDIPFFRKMQQHLTNG